MRAVGSEGNVLLKFNAMGTSVMFGLNFKNFFDSTVFNRHPNNAGSDSVRSVSPSADNVGRGRRNELPVQSSVLLVLPVRMPDAMIEALKAEIIELDGKGTARTERESEKLERLQKRLSEHERPENSALAGQSVIGRKEQVPNGASPTESQNLIKVMRDEQVARKEEEIHKLETSGDRAAIASARRALEAVLEKFIKDNNNDGCKDHWQRKLNALGGQASKAEVGVMPMPISSPGVSKKVTQRFANIHFVEKTRASDEDVHANILTAGNGKVVGIAAQYPLSEQMNPYLKMLIENHTKLVVVLASTDEIKASENKMPDYFHGKGTFGDITTSCEEQGILDLSMDDCALKLRFHEMNLSRGEEAHTVQVMHVDGWPDETAIPADILWALCTLQPVVDADGDLLVHCRAGVGRTGALMAGLRFRADPAETIDQVIQGNREQRGPMMVQTRLQLASVQSLYSNLQSEAIDRKGITES